METGLCLSVVIEESRNLKRLLDFYLRSLKWSLVWHKKENLMLMHISC